MQNREISHSQIQEWHRKRTDTTAGEALSFSHCPCIGSVYFILCIKLLSDRHKLCPVHQRMLQPDGSFPLADHDTASAVIAFSRIYHHRRLPLLRIREQNIHLTDIHAAVAAHTFRLIEDERTRAAWDYGCIQFLFHHLSPRNAFSSSL